MRMTSRPPRRPVNVTLPADLITRARAHNLNLSALLEQAASAEVRRLEGEQWKRDNAQAIAELNEDFEKNGLILEAYRTW